MIQKLPAFKTYLLYSFVTALLSSMIWTVFMVYYIDTVHMNPLQLVLVGTVLEAVCFVFEIPTGIVADIYSRKLSIIIGIAMMGIGFTVEGSIPAFAAVIASQVVWGIGATFISGAADAWVVEENEDLDLDHIYLRGSQMGQAGSVVGIVLATVLGNISVRIPIIASGSLFIVFAAFLALYMPENHFSPTASEDVNTFGKMKHTLKKSVSFIKKKRILLLLLSVTLFYGLSSEGFDRLYSAHFLQDTTLPKLGNLQPVTWFGIPGIAGMFLSAAAMQLIIKKLEKNNKIQSAAILLTTNIFFILGMIVFALTHSFGIMLAAFLFTTMFRSVNEPIFNAWLNRHIDDSARATVLSTNGQMNSLGQIVGGPIIGILATRFSVGIGIACTAVLLSPILVLYIISMINDKRHPGGAGE